MKSWVRHCFHCTERGYKKVTSVKGFENRPHRRLTWTFQCYSSFTHLTHALLRRPKSSIQMAPRSIQLFLHSSRQTVTILYNGPHVCPSKLSLPMWISGSHLTHGFFAPPKFLIQTASQSVELFLQGSLLWQTDRQPDRQTMLLGL